MSEQLVFCWEESQDTYGWFWHEADVLLYALGREVKQKKTTAAQAREVYAQYYAVKDTYETDPEDVEADIGEYGNFPLNEELEHLPNSSNFWREAAELGIAGVGFSEDISPASGEIFEVHGADALLSLQEAFQGRYRIVVLDDLAEYTDRDSEQVMQFIEQTQREQPGSAGTA